MGQYSREREYTDGKLMLEERLASIVAFLELYAERELEWKKQAKIQQIKYEKEKKLREETKAKKQKELADFNELISNSNRYHKVENIRNYINVIEKNAITTNSLNKELKKWINWARDKADWYDPLINKYDELLNDVEK